MGFRFTKASPAQHVMQGVVVGAAVSLGAWGPFRATWATMVQTVPWWVLVTFGCYVVHKLVFWPVALAFHYVDTHDRPAFIARYRIQDGKPRKPALSKVLKVLALNQVVLNPPLLALMAGVLALRGWQPSPELPSLGRLALEMTGMTLCSVGWFYSTHRFLHRTWWMKRVHRIHHEFRTTSALASEYAHPFEYIFGNFWTLALGVVLLAPSLATIYLYTVVGMLQVLVHHGGYAVPWMSWPMHHDWHHYKFSECFGTEIWLDRLLGTDTEFRALQDGDKR